jgi:TBCC domain-containing protein 1
MAEEEGFFLPGAGEEEEKETMMRARCRKEAFEYSGVIPSQLVGKHLSASSVLLSHQKTNNDSLVVSSSSSSLSFEQRVMQTQERLLERCERREEEEEEDKEEDKEDKDEKKRNSNATTTTENTNPFVKTLERRRVEDVLRENFEENNNTTASSATTTTTSAAYRRLNNNNNNNGKKLDANVKCILDAYEASLDTRDSSTAGGSRVRVDFFCLFLFMHGINLPSAKSPMKANAEWYSSLGGGNSEEGNDSAEQNNEQQLKQQQQRSERDKEEFVRMKFLISHWNDIKTIATKTDDLIDSPGLISANSWECFKYVFQFYDANEMREIDAKSAKEKLQTVQNIYRLLEDSLSSKISSFSGALKKPFELRVENLKKQTFARELVSSASTKEEENDDDEIISSCLIANCSESTVYVMAPVKHVRIDNVVDCSLFIGSVSSTIFLTRCERVHVVSASKYLFSKASHDCNFNVAVEKRPIFVGDSRGCVVGPYNSYYGGLSTHLKKCRLHPDSKDMTESWKSSRVISTNPDPDSGSESDSDLNNSNFSVCVQKPEDFGPFIVPFLPSEEIASGTAAAAGEKGGGEYNQSHDLAPSASIASPVEITRANPFRIPGEYVTSMDEKNELVATFRKDMVEKMSSGADSEKVAMIQREFRDWLKSTGNARHVGDLLKMERTSTR